MRFQLQTLWTVSQSCQRAEDRPLACRCGSHPDGSVRTRGFLRDRFKRVVAETECSYHLERLDVARQFTPTDNRVDAYFIPVPQAA